MREFLLWFSIFASCMNCYAFQNGDVNIMGGLGVFGSRGLIGFSADRFFSENHAATVAFGGDIIGAVKTAGYKYFFDHDGSVDTTPDKCLFVIDCGRYYYVGINAQYADLSRVQITTSGVVRDYETSPKWLGMVVVGNRDVFKSNITIDYELSYRSILSGGQWVQTSGPKDDNVKSLEAGYRNFGANIAIGYLF